MLLSRGHFSYSALGVEYCQTRLITVRSQPKYTEFFFVVVDVVNIVVVVVLIFVAVHVGYSYGQV